ncbi:unnamed protein product [Diabrotica balteata]|uniref:Uncharacterized protein n=1 Tax=Diabrotica balteata TaxID=107213 RepID=A0A9N9T7Z2_DIABA|nr:unnamed protein product [Diabrotica balteata]
MSGGFGSERIYLLGEKYSGLKARGALQNYEEIRKKYLTNNALFEDSQFQIEKIELGQQWDNDKNRIKWLRPQEIVSDPVFLEANEDRFDVRQGTLGDCWFLAALANITDNNKIMQRIIPDNQSFSQEYAGVFHFRFWQYGRWIDVVIDDRLPTIDGKLIFTKTKFSNVFWTPLLEKAYAKLYGSYQNIEGGFISEALEDFTGGLNERYLDLANISKDQDLFKMMLISFMRKSYMGCGILDSGEVEGERKDGLYSSHAYSINNVVEVTSKAEKVYKLLRLRNPWGTGEWTGDWSDHSKTWDLLPDETKNKLLIAKDDGEFWMQYEHFIDAYNLLEFCHPNPDSLAYEEDESHKWNIFMLDGSWVAKISNGGQPHSTNFWHNSQYLLKINDSSNAVHRVVIGLMQKNRRLYNLPKIPIGFAVYELKFVSPGRLTQNFFSSIKPVYVREPENNTQVTGHLDLPKGSYCIVPFTDEPQASCEFLLRVYSTVTFDVNEHEVDVRLIDPTVPLGGLRAPVDTVDGVAADKGIRHVFDNYADKELEVGWKELRCILELLFSNEQHVFSKELCRSMVALADTDLSGKLNFQEFYELWEQIGELKGIFKNFDSDSSNGMSVRELRQALRVANFQLSNKILSLIGLRYANEKDELELEDFLHCCVKLKLMIDIYNSKEKREYGLEQWLLETMYA